MHRRTKIQLTKTEDSVLRDLYRHFRVPDGQFLKRPSFAQHFLDVWNAATGRDDTLGEVLHYIATLRKKKQWVTLDGDHLKMPAGQGQVQLPAEACEIIDAEYSAMGIGSDNFSYEIDLVDRIHSKLILELGFHLPRHVLVTAIIDRRKAGDLPKSRGDGPDPDGDIGFSDIDEVG